MTAPIPRDIPDLPVIPGVATPLPALVPARAVLPLTRRPAAAAFRALVALAAAAGVGTELLLGNPLQAASHWSVQCGALVAAVFACSASRAWTARHPVSPLLTGGTLLYALVAGMVQHLLLTRGVGAFALTGANAALGTDDMAALAGGWQAMTGPLLHTVIPLAVAADWLLLTRPGVLRPSHAMKWLLFPLAYLAFTLVRGSLLADGSPTQYLYPFLDADTYGYRSVLPNALLLGLAIYTLAIALVAVDHIRPDPLRPRQDSPLDRWAPDNRRSRRNRRGPWGRRDRWDQLPENWISSPATSGLE
ncbi:Pr6Pr family membrane protein [Streptomyces poonensis]|uniref:Integral membrane regulator n=1 Tax=Streptomyces poonensis TaxID=68255 RepID=A0A918UIZ4_9ACTN|nr:Pr6Pr family membrane protein [Streptomyces poonensis]GGZ13657.1 integral membrane regulator [Streptomyces poonensis]GLJ91238.1 integral membrane regulator [Streptomyces poonensis]